jgi:hypothetical protein
MRIAADKVIAASRVTGRVTESKELVVEFGHDIPRRVSRLSSRCNLEGILCVDRLTGEPIRACQPGDLRCTATVDTSVRRC